MGAIPLSLVHDRNSSDLFYAEPHNEPLTEDGFAEWLDEQFRNTHVNGYGPTLTEGSVLEESHVKLD